VTVDYFVESESATVRMRCRAYLFALGLNSAAVFGLVSLIQSAEASDQTLSMEYGGRERTALIHVPASYDKQTPMPLVLVLHGGGGNAANAARMARMDDPADKRGFLVVYPNGTGRLKTALLTWNAWDCCGYAMENQVGDVGFLRALIGELKRTYAIDSRRIYVTGLSNGAIMSHRVGCEMADVIAAIAPVAGGLNTDSCSPSEPVSVIMFHGTADRHFRYDGGDGERVPWSAPRKDKPIPYAFATWSRIDGCSKLSGKEINGHVDKEVCSGGRNGTEVVLVSIDGQGHAWPGGVPGIRNGNVDEPTAEISATNTMIDFFLAHPKP
jgi:polyhydroxybutyrate depolymerase